MESASLSLIPILQSVNAPCSLNHAAAMFERGNGTNFSQGTFSSSTWDCQDIDWVFNSTSDCKDIDWVFNSPENFLYCLSLPSLLLENQEGLISPDDQGLLAGELDIVEKNDLGAVIVTNITGCFKGYIRTCQNEPLCSEAYGKLKIDDHCQNFLSSTDSFPISSNGSHGTEDCIDALCKSITATASTDIIGIGVFISYFLQAGCALSAFAVPILWDFGLYYVVLFAFRYKDGYIKARERAFRIHQRQTKHRDRLIPPLVEFHKTQCFFMFAVQVSAIASLNARLFGATSLQQLRNNYCVVTVLAFGGFVPITFVLLELRRLHQNSWYMLVISALTVAMSAATFHTASKSKLAAMDLSPLQGTSYMGCGLANPDKGNSSHPHYGAVEIFNSLEWSFGQIMALVVWMPPIAEYIVMELEGLAEGSAYRIPRDWTLTPRKSEQTKFEGTNLALTSRH
ncbi:hypothetical protein G7Y79_00019g046620 [Physcia stellaris]|nr:hypothetical protein G7Y79_00019g046620 [Physcia stellaris]